MQGKLSTIHKLSPFTFFIPTAEDNTRQTTMAVQSRVTSEEHHIRKFMLPTAIPNTVEDLLLVVGKTFQLNGGFGLLDKDFGNNFFSVTSTV